VVGKIFVAIGCAMPKRYNRPAHNENHNPTLIHTHTKATISTPDTAKPKPPPQRT
jgi:hypothetical protein